MFKAARRGRRFCFMKKATAFSIFVLILAISVQASWQKMPTGSLGWLRTIEFSDTKNGWVGGTKGVLLRTYDGGNTWQKVKSFSRDSILDIRFVNRVEGWALCERNIYQLGDLNPSYIMRTVDGGVTWKKQEFSDARRSRMSRLVFSDNGSGFAVGEMGTMFALDDNAEWKKKKSTSAFLFRAGAFSDLVTGAVVGGGGSILFTEDGGDSWTPARVNGRSRSMLNAVHFADRRTGWAVGTKGKVFQTVNGGRFWREQRSGVGAKLNAVHFLDRNRGWAVGEVGTILRTLNGGKTWFIERARTKNTLEDIDSNNGTVWAVGFGGTILRKR